MGPTPTDAGAVTVQGRQVAFRRYGAAAGPGVPTVLYAHGGLSCGADAALGHDAAVDRGVSLLAVDRPGVAGSSPLPGRRTADVAVDVAAVLDHLGIERAAGAVGWSLGGQYALACGALLPDRVPAVAVVAGVPPLSSPGVRRSLSVTDRSLLASVGPRAPGIVSHLLFGAVARQARRAAAARGDGPARIGTALRRTWGDADAAVLAQPIGATIDAAVAEATRSVDGMREEYRAWSRDWGVDPASVEVPVTVWQGDADRWVPAALGQQFASMVPGARLEPCPGQGHLLLATRWRSVLDGLLA